MTVQDACLKLVLRSACRLLDANSHPSHSYGCSASRGACLSIPGGLWKGGSQPPLTLAFQLHAHDEANDYILFEKEWNALGLGLDEKKSKKDLAEMHILHWNGMRKPWKSNGYNKAIWEPYYDRYAHL